MLQSIASENVIPAIAKLSEGVSGNTGFTGRKKVTWASAVAYSIVCVARTSSSFHSSVYVPIEQKRGGRNGKSTA